MCFIGGITMVDEIKAAFSALGSIEEVSSLNSKQEILQENADNRVLKNLLYLAYNPYLQFYIKKIPVSIDSCTNNEVLPIRYQGFLDMLVDFSKRRVTGNEAINELSVFLSGCNPEEYKWYTRVIGKDLCIGLADKGINKAFKGLIPTYEVLLADKIAPEDLGLNTPKALKQLPDNIVTQYKIDGYRLNIHHLESGEVIIRTRNGKYVKGYKDLEKSATKLPRGFVYDGEIVAPELFDWIQSNVKSHSNDVIANRDLFSEVMSHAFSKEDNKKGIFNVFDMIPIDEWVVRRSTQTYEERLSNLNKMVKPLELKDIMVVPTSRVYHKSNPDDLKEIVEQFHQFVNIGWEGLMVKDANSHYEWKRSKSLLKMKLMDTVDLVVTGIYEGTGKYEGMMGGVYCDYKGYQLGVGSGWSDLARSTYWSKKNLIIGKTIEVAYQAETKNKNGGLSLSFPVFKSIRLDK